MLSRCTLSLAILTGAFCAVLFAQENEPQGPLTDSRFQRTVLYLQEAPPELRADFAAAAIGVLAEAHAAEAELAREEAQLSGGDAKLASWSVAVDQYANRLMQLLAEAGTREPPVRLSLSPTESLAVMFGDSTVILSHPRADQQRAFEQRILVEFCTRHNCAQFTPSDDTREAIPVSSSRVRPNWEFTATGPVCSYRGIEVRFGSTDQLARSRLTCEQFLQEVMTLADEIAWQQRHAVAIDWDNITIRATPRKPQHIVQLNRSGDAMLATVPVIFGSPGLLEQIKPWLRSRVEDSVDGAVRLEAGTYGWEVH